ncbi:PLD nuclease N-terminal domain-containing protein [Ekhidna sp. MALMAid0563]|uniref:PLD nuclease N-terminal domain-containing protein n=1 Tax=Ekhidna sp. MALMAid0563 TaxID=3143937 RepID=UPI0032DF6753
MNYWLYISLFAAAIAVFAMVNVLLARMSNNKKALWFTLVVIFPIVGPLIYLLKRKSIVETS